MLHRRKLDAEPGGRLRVGGRKAAVQRVIDGVAPSRDRLEFENVRVTRIGISPGHFAKGSFRLKMIARNEFSFQDDLGLSGNTDVVRLAFDGANAFAE